MKNSNKNYINILSYCALMIVALLIFVDNLLPVVFGEITANWLVIFLNVLRTISNIFTVIVLGVSAYKFAEGNKKWIVILYWIAVVVFIVATVLLWL